VTIVIGAIGVDQACRMVEVDSLSVVGIYQDIVYYTAGMTEKRGHTVCGPLEM